VVETEQTLEAFTAVSKKNASAGSASAAGSSKPLARQKGECDGAAMK